ncbi:MAG: hypothetical protein GWO16_04150 [Gammaproteobacteria bacterium]|nr:hypothetical protein [Gammaproteobacteria bacterium]NIR98041.1 hypothetical protein [Gammaproteobacteria bacterium]NIT63748.1 hypothetical protein [Gammaproteobacteria bacterium]NIV19923.1 hypothetical protein [Gammaproteobacteria bacterium]NIX11412.1 hypothetical protein [Gammaproteobacteria bacterium]
MELVLVRHADAEPNGAYAEDALRPLTHRGRRIQEQVAAALSDMGLRPDRLLCSPRLRAWETAEILSEMLGAAEPEQLQVLDGGYGTGELVRTLARYPEHQRLLCVGHQPDIGTWAGELLCALGPVHMEFPKSAVLGLAFDGPLQAGAGILQFFYRPRDLQPLLGDHP